jgi:hypothetical protein
MEGSILTTTKKLIGIDDSYTAFDLDIITHINSAFVTLADLGVGPAEGFMIEDKYAEWSDFTGDLTRLNSIKTYIGFRVRLAFDPPSTSFHIQSLDEQRKELEWRLNVSEDTRESGTIPFEQPNS